MRTSMLANTVLTALLAAAGGPATPLSASALLGGGPPPAPSSMGTATVTVLHSLTFEPLPGLPVTVQRLDIPESTAHVFWTDRNGRALIRGLEDGFYVVFVDHNGRRSDPERFEIIGDYHPFVTLFFNPDIE